MSTYNGDKYLSKQVESIFNQDNVDTYLLIRDDGSSDQTISIIKNLQKEYPGKIKFFRGNNLGYKKSFMKLLKTVDLNKYDYFAFADQDDYWKSNKLNIAINNLNKVSNRYKLYASTVLITDSKLNVLYKKKIENFKAGFASLLTRVRLAGCTMVFNRELAKIGRKFNFKDTSNQTMPSHDEFMILLCYAINGFVYVDKNAYIYHRRLDNSVTSGGNGLKKRLVHEKDILFNHNGNVQYIAVMLIKTIPNMLSSDNLKYLYEILEYKKNIKNTLKLAFSSQVNCGIPLGNLETRIRILMRLW